MKTFVVVLICVLVMSCGDSEPPTHIAKPEPELVQYEIPSDIPMGLAEHFTDLQEHMTESEWHLFLDKMNRACDGQMYELDASTLRDDLSEKAVNAIEQLRKENKLLPREVNTRQGRIRVAGLAMPDVKSVEFGANYAYVLYLKNDYTIFVELESTVYKDGVGGSTTSGYYNEAKEYDDFIDRRIDCLSERIREAWVYQWSEEYIPRWIAGEYDDVENQHVGGFPTDEELARVRDFFENKYLEPFFYDYWGVDLVIIYVDGVRNLLTPEHADLIVDFDDALQATDEQLAEYNRIHSPDAYDCVEAE